MNVSSVIVAVSLAWHVLLFLQPSTVVNHQSNSIVGLREGDFVFRRSPSFNSRLILLLDDGSKFTHVGIAIVYPNAQVMILDIEPDANGTVKLSTIETYLARSEAHQVFRLNEESAWATPLALDVLTGWIGQKSFDAQFSLETDDSMYCTELVYKAFLDVGLDLLPAAPVMINIPTLGTKPILFPSLLMRSEYLKLSPLNKQEL